MLKEVLKVIQLFLGNCDLRTFNTDLVLLNFEKENRFGRKFIL